MPPSAGVLHHELSGNVATRTPVLMLRPLGGTLALWGEFRDRLAARRALIACEARGIGRSPAAPVATTTRSMALAAAGLLDQLGIRSAHVFGLSLGGMVATYLAIERPDLVRGLVLASTPLRGLAVMREPLRNLRFVACLARPRGDREAFMIEQVLSPRFRTDEPERVTTIVDQARRDGGTLRSLLVHAAAGVLHDPRRELARARAPTLCLAGDLDDVVGTRTVEQLARAMPRATFQLIAGAGHDLSLERPRELATRVADFFDACETSS